MEKVTFFLPARCRDLSDDQPSYEIRGVGDVKTYFLFFNGSILLETL